MSYLEYNIKFVPTGPRKFLYINWPLALLLAAVASVGFLMLYSVAGGDISRWAEPQMKRFGVGFLLMLFVAMVPIYFWRNVSAVAYGISILLLIAVELFGDVGMGAQRWINLGFMRLQPSELMKITLVMLLAAYYDWLPLKKISHPLWVAIPVLLILIPTALVLRQPDLGTAILLLTGGGALMFMAGVHWAYFLAVVSAGIALITAVFESRGTTWQLLNNYQYKRIDTFLDPSADPLNAGYHITQSKIALGSGGWTGRGFMQGTQSRLNFLPEKHTDFIFTTLSEEFGFVGVIGLLTVYLLIIFRGIFIAVKAQDSYSRLLAGSLVLTFFIYIFVNIGMVSGILPVVGVPLPLVSYGGTSAVTLMAAFGVLMSVHTHRKMLTR